MATIEARGLRKTFGTTVALEGIDLHVEEGRILGIIGPNGAGKTTALNAILGLTSYEGELKVLGRDPWTNRDRPRGRPSRRGLRRDPPELQHLQRRRVRRGARGRVNRIYLEHGEPVRFGAEGERGVVARGDGTMEIVDVAEVGEDALLVHDEHHPQPSLAFALSRLELEELGVAPMGVFRDVEEPVYDELMTEQIRRRSSRRRGRPHRAPARQRHLDDRADPTAGQA